MNIYDMTIYVNQDADDTFSFREVALWFNKAIANFNLIPPVTRYPFVIVDNPTTDDNDEFLINGQFNDDETLDLDGGDDEIGAKTDYPLSKTFMLGVILPYIVSAIKGAESSLSEKQLALQEFMMNAKQFKSIQNITPAFLADRSYNPELDMYRIGENVYVTDFNESPFAGDWGKATSYKEVLITRDSNNELVKKLDDSLIDEEV